MTIDEIQEKIVADFEELGDSFDQYAYLIEISAAHEGLSDGDKTPERLVEGCQSRVWLKISTEGGIFSFSSDSDTLIVKGVLELLQQMLNGQTCADVSRAEVTFLQRTAVHRFIHVLLLLRDVVAIFVGELAADNLNQVDKIADAEHAESQRPENSGADLADIVTVHADVSEEYA